MNGKKTAASGKGNAAAASGKENAVSEKNAGISSRVWCMVIFALAAVSLLVLTAYNRHHMSSVTAGIYQNGVCIRSVDLSRAAEEERFWVEGETGKNLICIQPGRICVEEADCPDQICVLQGWLPEGNLGNLPIICLPHGLLIQIEDAP